MDFVIMGPGPKLSVKKHPDEKAALHQNYTVNSKGIIIITNNNNG